MKKIFAIIFGAAAIFAASCTNLDEEIYSQVPKKEFLDDASHIALYTSRPYTYLQKWGVEQSMLTMIIQLSNETGIPYSWDAHWGEDRYTELQTHRIPTNCKLVRTSWDFCFDGIAACNDAIYVLENAPQTETSAKNIAEIKTLRAYYYLMAVDCWGNVPFSVSREETSYPVQKDRAEMLTWLEGEIKSNMAPLDSVVSTRTYGRITREVSRFLLAKIYLNSEKWTGVKRYKECEDVCDSIMKGGNFTLATKYEQNFAIHNENGKEAIFAIPHSSVYTTEAFYIYVMTFGDDLAAAYNIPGASWQGTQICQPDFFDTYDPADLRRDLTWLHGQVYDYTGAKYAYKQKNADGTITMVDYILNPSPIDADVFGKNSKGLKRLDGARIIKWPYQTDGTLQSYKISMENDFYLMRYSDVVLMYVEALLRQDKAVQAASVPEFIQIRTRAGLAPIAAGDLTLDALYTERSHELALEGWARQDLIRFGKYTQAWWAKEADPTDGGYAYTELLPIPEERIGDNPNLKQNRGYVAAKPED
ncbi:MAG: RagB/SusD family nutrient uptake outer membrane protein [Bacteroidales bacterium]|nr:RagB/SusD family nutrient uptake outer membrane protein [Bacteroidales bacterium]